MFVSYRKCLLIVKWSSFRAEMIKYFVRVEKSFIGLGTGFQKTGNVNYSQRLWMYRHTTRQESRNWLRWRDREACWPTNRLVRVTWRTRNRVVTSKHLSEVKMLKKMIFLFSRFLKKEKILQRNRHYWQGIFCVKNCNL